MFLIVHVPILRVIQITKSSLLNFTHDFIAIVKLVIKMFMLSVTHVLIYHYEEIVKFILNVTHVHSHA